MSQPQRNRQPHWDPYTVWLWLLHKHPVRVENPAGSCGRIEAGQLREFFEAISDYPDFLQDALLVIAHADGIGAAYESLDAAIRETLQAGTA